MIPTQWNRMGKKASPSFFELTVTTAADKLTWGFKPTWSSGGYCHVDWGDGSQSVAATSGAMLTHTYAQVGSFKVRIKGSLTAIALSAYSGDLMNYAKMIGLCNFNWRALGDNLNTFLFINSTVSGKVKTFPPNQASMRNAFYGTAVTYANADAIPDTCGDLYCAFFKCENIVTTVTKLPAGLNVSGALWGSFYRCTSACVNLDRIAENAPQNGWTGIKDLTNFASGSGAFGSIAGFMRCLPNATAGQNAFQSTNCTTFGSADYFEAVLTTTTANQSWGFTPTSSAGTWYCFDWGDGTAVTANKNLDVFTSGVKVSHTFAAPGTYRIKLAMNASAITFDAYDSDNGKWEMLGNPSHE